MPSMRWWEVSKLTSKCHVRGWLACAGDAKAAGANATHTSRASSGATKMRAVFCRDARDIVLLQTPYYLHTGKTVERGLPGAVGAATDDVARERRYGLR